jgi:hypothetical protein
MINSTQSKQLNCKFQTFIKRIENVMVKLVTLQTTQVNKRSVELDILHELLDKVRLPTHCYPGS